MSERLVSFVATRKVIHLTTIPQFPPIPVRHFDWAAIDSNDYDADWQGEESGFVSTSPQGEGETEQEAIDALFDELETACS